MARFAALCMLVVTLCSGTYATAQTTYQFSDCPSPPPPRCKSVLAGSTKEDAFIADYKNIETDSRVTLTERGQVKVCNYPVPLDPRTCRPHRKGVLTLCALNQIGDECPTITKDGTVPQKFEQELKKFAVHALDRAVAAETAAIVLKMDEFQQAGLPALVFEDPHGILVPISEAEPPVGSDSARYVNIPTASIDAIAADVPDRLRELYRENPDLANQRAIGLILNYSDRVMRMQPVLMDETGITVGKIPREAPRDTLEIFPPSTFVEPSTGVYSEDSSLDTFSLRRDSPVWNTPLLDPLALPKPQLISTLPTPSRPSPQGFFSRVRSLFSDLFGI